MTNKNDYRLALITWTDAETYGDTSWISLEEAIEQANTAPPLMRSVGWVLYKDENYIALTSDFGPNECGHITKVPLSMVITMEWLDTNDE